MAERHVIEIRVQTASDDAKLKDAQREVERLANAGSKASFSLGGLISGIKGLAIAGVAAKAISVLTGAISSLWETTKESILANAKLEGVLNATGYAAGVSAEQIDTLAGKMQSLTGISDETIKGAAAVLATFRGVNATNFERALKASADLSVLFGSMESAALKLGKALEDPEHGLTALRRSGVMFTDAEEEMIKTMVASGDTARAQAEVLRLVERRVGGLAEQVGKTLPMQLEAMKNSWEDVKQSMGEAALKQLPMLQDALKGITDALSLLAAGMKSDLPVFRTFLEELIRFNGNPLLATMMTSAAIAKAGQEAKDKPPKIKLAEIPRFELPVRTSADAAGKVYEKIVEASDKALAKIIENDDKIREDHEKLMRSLMNQQRYAALGMITTDRASAKERENAARKVRESVEEEIAVRRALADEAERIQQAQLEQERIVAEQRAAVQQMQMQLMDQFAGVMVTAFGRNKEVQVAATLISTWAAAQEAYLRVVEVKGLGLAAQPMAVAAAAMAVAQGLARVKAIMDTDIGTKSTRAGSAGGHVSVSRSGSFQSTMASPYTGGGRLASGAAGGERQSSVTYNMTANALTSTDAVEALRRMEKKRVIAARSYKRGTINRGQTTIGRT